MLKNNNNQKKWFYNNRSCLSSCDSRIDIFNGVLSVAGIATITERYSKKK